MGKVDPRIKKIVAVHATISVGIEGCIKDPSTFGLARYRDRTIVLHRLFRTVPRDVTSDDIVSSQFQDSDGNTDY